MQLCIRMPITAVFGAFSQDSSGSMAGLDFTLGQGHASPILSMQGYRQAQEEDLETLYDICLQTAWAGGDASGEVFYSDLLGDLFVGPIMHRSIPWRKFCAMMMVSSGIC